jgi:hypothetical protein
MIIRIDCRVISRKNFINQPYMSIQKNSDEVADVGFRPVSDIRPKVPEKLGSDVINVGKSVFIIQITGRMSDGHPSFSGILGRMSDTGLNPTSATSSEFF